MWCHLLGKGRGRRVSLLVGSGGTEYPTEHGQNHGVADELIAEGKPEGAKDSGGEQPVPHAQPPDAGDQTDARGPAKRLPPEFGVVRRDAIWVAVIMSDLVEPLDERCAILPVEKADAKAGEDEEARSAPDTIADGQAHGQVVGRVEHPDNERHHEAHTAKHRHGASEYEQCLPLLIVPHATRVRIIQAVHGFSLPAQSVPRPYGELPLNTVQDNP